MGKESDTALSKTEEKKQKTETEKSQTIVCFTVCVKQYVCNQCNMNFKTATALEEHNDNWCGVIIGTKLSTNVANPMTNTELP